MRQEIANAGFSGVDLGLWNWKPRKSEKTYASGRDCGIPSITFAKDV